MLQRVQQLRTVMGSATSTDKTAQQVNEKDDDRNFGELPPDQQIEQMPPVGLFRGLHAGCCHVQDVQEFASRQDGTDVCSATTYRACKFRSGSAEYTKLWQELRRCGVFCDWIQKPESLESFAAS